MFVAPFFLSFLSFFFLSFSLANFYSFSYNMLFYTKVAALNSSSDFKDHLSINAIKIMAKRPIKDINAANKILRSVQRPVRFYAKSTFYIFSLPQTL
jgi:hypothetical protein